MFENKMFTPISELGEFGLIDHLTKDFKSNHPETFLGPGDDAALIDIGKDYMAVSTDFLIEGTHFDLSFTPLKHLGYKAVTVNLSDIYAMNATPKQITVSLSISSKYTLEAVEEIYSGIKTACDKYGVDLIGGDTGSCPSGMTISITALGLVEKGKEVLRKGAAENDILCVSGDLGSPYLGLQLLEREKAVFLANPEMQPDLEGFDYLIQRQLRPEARKDIVELFADNAIIPTSMIDISDGLASEILHLSKASGMGFQIMEEKLPIDTTAIQLASDFNLSTTTCMLNGGEDYELLFTLKGSDYEKLSKNFDITAIGFVTGPGEKCNLVTPSGSVFEIKAQGWDAFKAS